MADRVRSAAVSMSAPTGAADTWQDEPGIEPAPPPNMLPRAPRRGFWLPLGERDTRSALRGDFKRDPGITTARLRAISDALIEAAAASRARLADIELDDAMESEQ
jgi:hypothetical protein